MSIIPLALIGLVFGIAITFAFELVLKTNRKLRNRYYKQHQIFYGYHVHHSVYGLLLFVLSAILFYKDQTSVAIFFLFTAIGIITQHTISDKRLVFIETQKQ